MDASSTLSNKRGDAEKDATVKDIEVCGPLYRGGACNFNSCAHSSDHYHCPVCGHSTTEISQALSHVGTSPACRKDTSQGQYPSCSLSDAATANSLYNALYGGLTAQNAFPASGFTSYNQMDSFQWHPSLPVDKVAICSTQLSPCCGSNGTNRIPVDGQLCSPLGDLYSKVTAPKDLVSLPAKSGGTTMDSQAWFAAYNSQQIQKPVYKYPDQNSLPQINFLLLDPSEQKHQDINLLPAGEQNLNVPPNYSVNKPDLNGRDLMKETYCSYASQSMTGMLPEDAMFSLQLSDDTLKQADLFHNHQQTFLPQINMNEPLTTSNKKATKIESSSNSTRFLNRFTQEHFGNCVSSCSVYSSTLLPVKHLDENDENSNQTTSSASDSDESDIIVEDTGDELATEIAESEISIEDIKCSLLQGVVSEEENIHNAPKNVYHSKSRRDSEKLRKESANLINLAKESDPHIRCAVCSKSEEAPGSFFIQMSTLLPVTSTSNTPILAKLSQIITMNLVDFLNDFGNVICQRCFSLVDAVDSLEIKLESARQNLASIFKGCSKAGITNSSQCTKIVVDLIQENESNVIEIPMTNTAEVKSPVENVTLQSVDTLLSVNIETNSNDCRQQASEAQQACNDSQVEELRNVEKDAYLIISSEVSTSVGNPVEIQSPSHGSCQTEMRTEGKCAVQPVSSATTCPKSVVSVLPQMPHISAPPPIHHQAVVHLTLEQQNQFFNNQKSNEPPLSLSKQVDKPGNETEAEPKSVNVNENILENKHNFSCENCNEVFQKQKDLDNHKSVDHNSESNLLCETCGKRFHLRKQLDYHKAHHKKVLSEHCQYCGKSFASASLLIVHVRTHTGERPFTCSSCERGFAHRSNLTAHRNICSGLSPFRCEKCDQIFPLRSALDKHIKTAHDLVLELLKCTECNRSFSKPSDLQAHTRVHSSERSFACEVCGRRYKSLGNLNHHMKSHMLKRPFSCDLCNQGFLRKEALEAHVNNAHKGEKPFTCEKCSKSFWSKKNLRSHFKWHDGTLKKNTCPICDKTFTQKLRVHMRTHTGERPFNCQFCSLTFSTKHSLKKHCNAKHPPTSLSLSMSSSSPSCP